MSKRFLIKEFENLGNQIASMCSSLDYIKENLQGFFDTRMENMFELGRIAEAVMQDESIDLPDSRVLFEFCLKLSEEFEDRFDPDTGDYYIEISEFGTNELLKKYGLKIEVPTKPMKSYEAYVCEYHTVCYIPDNAESFEDHYTHSQLLALVSGDEKLCRQLFDTLSGEFPSTLIESFLTDGLWAKCNYCGRYYSEADTAIECPHCHGLISGDENPLDVYKAAIEKGE